MILYINTDINYKDYLMEVITFTAKIAPRYKHYHEYKEVRIILDTNTNDTRIEVFNDNKVLCVNSVSILLQFPFTGNKYLHGYLYLHKPKMRYVIQLRKKYEKDLVNMLYLSKYNYIINHPDIYLNGLDPNYQVDHINNNKLDDRLDNLTYITSEHNKDKSNYNFWLPYYNETFNTNYTEADLADIEIMNKIKSDLDPLLPSLRHKNKREYIKQYRIDAKELIRKTARTYRENNKEHRTKIVKAWKERNKDYVKQCTAEYNTKNKTFIIEKGRIFKRLKRLKSLKWTQEIGKEIQELVMKFLDLHKLTLKDIVNGLSLNDFKYQSIKFFNELLVLFNEQQLKFESNVESK